eukprot:75023_1
MLTVFTKRLSNLYHHQYRFFAAASAFDGFSDRISKLKSSYPNLFNRDSFISDQEQLLSQYKSSLNSLLSEYDAARESIDKATGEKVFIELNESTLINDLNTRNKPFYESLSENVNEIQEKLSTGQEYVNRVIELQSQQESALCIEDKNLQMIEIANVGDKIDEWQLSFADPVNDSSDLGLPISDEEVDQWGVSNYTKSLFRASLWQSKDRCNTVEESIEILINLLEDGRDDDSKIRIDNSLVRILQSKAQQQMLKILPTVEEDNSNDILVSTFILTMVKQYNISTTLYFTTELIMKLWLC